MVGPGIGSRWGVVLATVVLAPGLARAQEAVAAPPPAAEVAAEAEALRARVAAGTLAEERLELAALLGHKPAELALGRAAKRDALTRCGHEASVRLALAGARAAVKRWGGEPPELLARALAGAEAWVACPCDRHRADCAGLEAEVRAFMSSVMQAPIDFDAPDASARVDELERRAPVMLSVSFALLVVRAPLERALDGPAPAPGIALDVVGQAGAAEACTRRAEHPQPTEAAARLWAEALAGGGHGRPSRETVEGGREDLARYEEAAAAFRRAAVDRVLVEVRAAYLPWLLTER